MALADKMKSQLRLVQQVGSDADTGKPIYKTKTFNNIKVAASADELHAVATAIAGLQEWTLARVERRDDLEITQ